MGAQPDVVDILHIFIAIAAHKGLAAYALGSSLVDAKSEGPRFWSVIGAFAVATPVGILLGTLLASFASGRAAAGLSALASGAPSLLLLPSFQSNLLAGSSLFYC